MLFTIKLYAPFSPSIRCCGLCVVVAIQFLLLCLGWMVHATRCQRGTIMFCFRILVSLSLSSEMQNIFTFNSNYLCVTSTCHPDTHVLVDVHCCDGNSTIHGKSRTFSRVAGLRGMRVKDKMEIRANDVAKHMSCHYTFPFLLFYLPSKLFGSRHCVCHFDDFTLEAHKPKVYEQTIKLMMTKNRSCCCCCCCMEMR